MGERGQRIDTADGHGVTGESFPAYGRPDSLTNPGSGFSEAHIETNSAWETAFDSEADGFFIVGYSSARRVEDIQSIDLSLRRKGRHVRYLRIAGLFEEHVALTPLGAWLPGLKKGNPGRFEQIKHLMDDLLPKGTRFTGNEAHNEYLFEHNGLEVPFTALSDGYRSYIGWIADLLYHVLSGVPSGTKLRDLQGVVLVDEIDLHLHPSWQRVVVPQLASALPHLQFVFTTHSPIIAGFRRWQGRTL